MLLLFLQDKQPSKLPNFSGYAGIYRDVRAAVDLCHRDGSLKRHVASDPSKYIHDVSIAFSAAACTVERYPLASTSDGLVEAAAGGICSSGLDPNCCRVVWPATCTTYLPCYSSSSVLQLLFCNCVQDPHLVSMLQMYKKSGRKLFLATNSLWDYTNVVMNYLCGSVHLAEIGKSRL